MAEGGYKIRDQKAIHFITFAVVEWIDVFTRKDYSEIVVNSLKFCQQNKALQVHAWVIMSNHLHLILSAKEESTLSDILRDFKKFTSSQILKSIEKKESESRKKWMLWIFSSKAKINKRNDKYQFWQQDNHAIECSTEEILDSRMKYLHENPLRAGLVRNEWEYTYSSAIDYYKQEKGMIEIDYL
jgi:REP element-mobilizing transposase RayT